MVLERAALEDLPDRGTVALAGAGGKTTMAHFLADYYRGRGLKVFLTTTTHMRKEPDTMTDKGAAIAHLKAVGYAFAGASDPGNSRKIMAFPDKVSRTLCLAADLTVVEADGARGLPLKAPRPWEPALPPGTAALILVMGMDACGRPLSEVCFNAEGAFSALGAEEGRNILVTEALMLEIYERTYLARLSQHGGLPFPIFILKNYKRGRDHLADSLWRVRGEA